MKRLSLLGLLAIAPAPQGGNLAITADNLVITRDTTLKPGTYVIRDSDRNGAIRIAKDGITLNGNGAILDGMALEGIGLVAEGVSRVTVKNLTIRGFATGAKIVRGEKWTFEENTFTQNYSNADAKWGNGDPVAGLVLEEVKGSTIRKNRLGKQWNGILLKRCDENAIEENDASHVDNWGIRLWRSSRNSITSNDFSYAIRCEKEAHACDSAAILVESGSDGNRFVGNNATHSGDGIFVRALDAIVSTGNQFAGNDVSFAHNNGVESWCPRNSFFRNLASRCAYGFWLGSSDETDVRSNIIKENGVEGTNTANGTAGLAYIGGGVHVRIQENRIEGNAGPGIHLRGNPPAYPDHHILIQGNTIIGNGEGILVERASFVEIRGNEFSGNKKQPDVVLGEGTTDVQVREGSFFEGRDRQPAYVHAAFEGPERVDVGEEATFDAGKSRSDRGRVNVRWDLGDGTKAEGTRVQRRYAKAGFHRICAFVSDQQVTSEAHRDLYVVSKGAELTEQNADKWGGVASDWANGFVRVDNDAQSKVKGRSSIHAVTNGGADVMLFFPKTRDAAWNLTGMRALQMWVKFVNENDSSFQNNTPILRLVSAKKGEKPDAHYVELRPKTNLLGLTVPYSEGRWLFCFLDAPLAGDSIWERKVVGEPDLSRIDALEIHADTWGAGFELWLDGVQFVK